MDAYLVHALVISPFESTLQAQTFDELMQEDYSIHKVYNAETQEVIFTEVAFEGNPIEKVALIQRTLEVFGITTHWKKVVQIQGETGVSK